MNNAQLQRLFVAALVENIDDIDNEDDDTLVVSLWRLLRTWDETSFFPPCETQKSRLQKEVELTEHITRTLMANLSSSGSHIHILPSSATILLVLCSNSDGCIVL